MKNFGAEFAGKLTAIALTMLIVLPAIAIFLFAASSYLSSAMVPILPFDAGTNSKILFAIRAVCIAVFISFAYFWLANWMNFKLSDADSERGQRITEAIQPWIFIGPAILLLFGFLVYPTFETFRISLTNDIPLLDALGNPVLNDAGDMRQTLGFVGLANYATVLTSENFWLAIRNSVLWLFVVPTTCIIFGMLIAVLADNVRWGTFAKSMIFVPMAISFVGAAVIWRNIYADGGTATHQIGLLNALLSPLGVEPRFWYEMEFWGNFYMMGILVWIQTGFAMVIFSAALRSVPQETIEAAKIDGATPVQTFFRITLPQIYSTVVVVWTTLTILVLKVFDIPFALTANKADKLLLATYMEQTRNSQRDPELAAAIAIILMLTIVPIMLFNLWRIRVEARNG
ncbi:alpha-glucoside ABC transporter permease [Amylibacter ulvae]|uniref:Alpha-glucoside ABC transporter permease n=1 Tax=Paramylibacter ulvae TaxID=1651968 RepID=A0ABQ3D5Y5_9RHOB|nr:sugar ABC transporter permease [Amylibacter ulvae]GHA57331.1 alpha-glucoside ABC transporter permease [Amylibacter ulvae]